MKSTSGSELNRISAQFARAAKKQAKTPYVFRLYISGTTPQSQRAVSNLKRICEDHLLHSYDIEIIDVYQFPLRAKEDHIIAVPTLIKLRPLPLKQLLGDLSNEGKVLAGLGLTRTPRAGNRSSGSNK